MKEKGPGYPMVLSSRARLARNIEGLPFPGSADEEDLERARGIVIETVSRQLFPDREWNLIFAEEATREELEWMAEEHLLGPAFSERLGGRALAVRWPDSRSVLVNDQDHLRIQATLPGGQFMRVYEIADDIDDSIEKEVQYSFDQKLGYMTSCPSDVGTGLRVSAMLHLPALIITGEIAKTITALGQSETYVRGLYGDGSGVAGNLFQVANRKTLGSSEREIILHLEAVTKQVVDKERTARKMLMRDTPVDLYDRVYRALGVVERARRMCFFEALELLSLIKLGVEMEILPLRDFNLIEVCAGICPFHLRVSLEGEVDDEDVDLQRAPRLRMLLDL